MYRPALDQSLALPGLNREQDFLNPCPWEHHGVLNAESCVALEQEQRLQLVPKLLVFPLSNRDENRNRVRQFPALDAAKRLCLLIVKWGVFQERRRTLGDLLCVDAPTTELA